MRYHDPFFNNMDLEDDDWRVADRQSYRGIGSLIDINLGRLLISPRRSPVTEGSYPVLLYGTFWYQHIRESNLIRLSASRTRYVAGTIYVLALVPTFLFLRGLGKLVRDLPRLVRHFDGARLEDLRGLMRSTAAMILVLGAVMIWITAWRYHEWSAMQGRLLFPWMFGGVAVFAAGVPLTAGGRMGGLLRGAMFGLTSAFLVYFAAEIGSL